MIIGSLSEDDSSFRTGGETSSGTAVFFVFDSDLLSFNFGSASTAKVSDCDVVIVIPNWSDEATVNCYCPEAEISD